MADAMPLEWDAPHIPAPRARFELPNGQGRSGEIALYFAGVERSWPQTSRPSSRRANKQAEGWRDGRISAHLSFSWRQVGRGGGGVPPRQRNGLGCSLWRPARVVADQEALGPKAPTLITPAAPHAGIPGRRVVEVINQGKGIAVNQRDPTGASLGPVLPRRMRPSSASRSAMEFSDKDKSGGFRLRPAASDDEAAVLTKALAAEVTKPNRGHAAPMGRLMVTSREPPIVLVRRNAARNVINDDHVKRETWPVTCAARSTMVPSRHAPNTISPVRRVPCCHKAPAPPKRAASSTSHGAAGSRPTWTSVVAAAVRHGGFENLTPRWPSPRQVVTRTLRVCGRPPCGLLPLVTHRGGGPFGSTDQEPWRGRDGFSPPPPPRAGVTRRPWGRHSARPPVVGASVYNKNKLPDLLPPVANARERTHRSCNVLRTVVPNLTPSTFG